jgi:hypothetical protein
MSWENKTPLERMADLLGAKEAARIRDSRPASTPTQPWIEAAAKEIADWMGNEGIRVTAAEVIPIIQRAYAPEAARLRALLEQARATMIAHQYGYAEESGLMVCNGCGSRQRFVCQPDCAITNTLAAIDKELGAQTEAKP